jgi:hypothetical protein
MFALAICMYSKSIFAIAIISLKMHEMIRYPENTRVFKTDRFAELRYQAVEQG